MFISSIPMLNSFNTCLDGVILWRSNRRNCLLWSAIFVQMQRNSMGCYSEQSLENITQQNTMSHSHLSSLLLILVPLFVVSAFTTAAAAATTD